MTGAVVHDVSAAHRAAILAELRRRIQRVRGTMSDEVFETLLERMTDQRLADELRGERP